MGDYRDLEFIWDKPTKLFNEIKKYFKSNPEFSREFKPSSDLENFVYNLMLKSYHSNQAELTTSFKSIKDHGLILAKENNGKEFAIWKHPLRIDLYGLTSFVSEICENINFGFDDKIIDGENEIAESNLFLGYEDFNIKNLEDSLPYFTNKVPYLKDNRISEGDLFNIKYFIENEFENVECNYERTLFNEKDGNQQIKEIKELTSLRKNIAFPYSYLNRFGYGDDWSRFFQSSLISLKGSPSEVRKASLNLLSLCFNENLKAGTFNEGRIFEKFKIDKINLDSNYDLRSQSWSYKQWLPQNIRGC